MPFGFPSPKGASSTPKASPKSTPRASTGLPPNATLGSSSNPSLTRANSSFFVLPNGVVPPPTMNSLLLFPRLVWSVLLYLDLRDLGPLRLAGRRLEKLVAADHFWTQLANALLLTPILPRNPPSTGGVMHNVLSHAMRGMPLCGVYTFRGDNAALYERITLRIRRAGLGFELPIARIHLSIKWQASEEDELAGTMRYCLRDKRFKIITRRRGLRGMVNGPRFAVLCAPHNRPWWSERAEHFAANTGGIRLVLTVENPETWSAFYVSQNDMLCVMRKAPELAITNTAAANQAAAAAVGGSPAIP